MWSWLGLCTGLDGQRGSVIGQLQERIVTEGILGESATGNGPVGKEVSSAGGTASLLQDASGCGIRPGV